MMGSDSIEEERLVIQQQLDLKKSRVERNKLGQFATPTVLATDILDYARSLLPSDIAVRFLDPAFGTGSFVSALFRSFPSDQIKEVVGFEIDQQYAQYALRLWKGKPLQLHIADFTQAIPPEKDDQRFNLLICNPPYVRHHYLQKEDKQRLRKSVKEALEIKVNECSGLYCYFLWLAHQWLAKDALAGWLIPSEFISARYGQQLREYLLKRVTLLRIHCFDPENVQFNDALVSSSIIWFRNISPSSGHTIEFTYGGTLTKPAFSGSLPASALSQARKWTIPSIISRTTDTAYHNTDAGTPEQTINNPEVCKNLTWSSNSFYFRAGSHTASAQKKLQLSDLFVIKRGLATGANDFFLLTPEQIAKYQISSEFLLPILPNSRYILNEEIKADSKGSPIVEKKLFLLSCDLSEKMIEDNYPPLWKYLQTGIARGINKRYLCSHRTPWYSQEKRPSAPFICCYMGRQKAREKLPFRFILNRSKALVTNSYYALYPRPYLEKAFNDDPALINILWQLLKNIPLDNFMHEGRVYGGGLYKIEPGDLAHIFLEESPTFLSDLLNTCDHLYDLRHAGEQV